ncbi:trigger factor [soil metagenome]
MSVEIVEKSGEGLSRVYGVKVPAAELNARLTAKIDEMRPRMNLKGFRPGKVPAAHVKKMYGREMMREIVQESIGESQKSALDQAKLRPAAEPDIRLESDLDQVLLGQADLAYDIDVQLMPEFEPMDPATIELKRPIHTADDAEVESQLKEIADGNKSYADKKGKTPKLADGDMAVIDFKGTMDGELFEGGSADDMEIVIGAGRFIPGFEEGLTGAKVGETRTLAVTFPADYGAAQLAGKPAQFEVTVKAVRSPEASGELDDAFAERLGMPSLEALKDALRSQIQSQYDRASRFRAKRHLLDVLDEKHDFELPPRMVEAEFETIWRQVEDEKQKGELSDEDKAKSDDQLKTEYRKIAERRVRLGLILAEIGRKHDVQVTDQELQGALMAEARRYPGQEQEVYDFFRQNPQSAAQLRAPIYEEKVVDVLLGEAKITDEEVSKDDLFADDELPDSYKG